MVKKTLLLLIFLISCTGGESVIEEPKSLNSEEVLNVIFESYKNFSDDPEKAVDVFGALHMKTIRKSQDLKRGLHKC